MNKINITASNIEGFKEIDDKLKELPESVLEQIGKAKRGICGVHCEFVHSSTRDSSYKIYLPKGVTQIKNFGDYIGIYFDDFFFEIRDRILEEKIEYLFI